MTAPRATMRLQLHRDFTFEDAARLVPYMAKLGISHLYASPILTARPGSLHGYDVTDPTQVNPELGGEGGLRQLVATLRGAGLGLIVDIVPNHMAAGGLENPWWGDVLRHGRASRYAGFFDIDWDAADPALRGKLLAPFLGEPYGDALREGSIRLERDGDTPLVRYYDSAFPLRPEDEAEVMAAPAGAFDATSEEGRVRLHRLLERQHYRLAWWRSAGDTINWRRFFDINGLAGLRIEDEPVFEATHATLFRLYEEGLIDGMRVDHVDGLADPPGYCRQLRARLEALAPRRPATAPRGPAWLVVEKILGAGERLPGDWAVDGTSGYDFMDEVSALLHADAGEAPLRALWGTLSGRPTDFAQEETAARRGVLSRSFAAQLDAAVAAAHRVALSRLETRDISAASIRRAMAALLAHFPRYRSYGEGRSDALSHAAAAARHDVAPADRTTLAWLERALGEAATPQTAVRFQQLSAPLAAKAVEDTAYYRYGVLLSRNEVGADVRRFGIGPGEFHARCLARRRDFPDAMLATATHDHKRGEDLRARLAVLSEIPEEWAATVRAWFELNAPHRRQAPTAMPSPGDEAMLYQMIVAAWPTDLAGSDRDGVSGLAERLADWQLKALREAKLATDWTAPDVEYEDAARSFLYTILADRDFAASAEAVARRIGPAGALNGLAQTLLKLTVPGVPDFYQGTEYWDQSLVDPDNRRPVDFERRQQSLDAGLAPAQLAAGWQDGRVKQAVILRALALRREYPALFARGEYRPLEVTGPRAAHVVAFVRSLGEARFLVVVPRLVCGLLGEGIDIPEAHWRDTRLSVPVDIIGRAAHDRISDSRLGPLEAQVATGTLLARFPLALLAIE